MRYPGSARRRARSRCSRPPLRGSGGRCSSPTRSRRLPTGLARAAIGGSRCQKWPSTACAVSCRSGGALEYQENMQSFGGVDALPRAPARGPGHRLDVRSSRARQRSRRESPVYTGLYCGRYSRRTPSHTCSHSRHAYHDRRWLECSNPTAPLSSHVGQFISGHVRFVPPIPALRQDGWWQRLQAFRGRAARAARRRDSTRRA